MCHSTTLYWENYVRTGYTWIFFSGWLSIRQGRRCYYYYSGSGLYSFLPILRA